MSCRPTPYLRPGVPGATAWGAWVEWYAHAVNAFGVWRSARGRAGRWLARLSLVVCVACGGEDVDVERAPPKVTVLGSSTAFGVGPDDASNSWVERYRVHLENQHPGAELVNLSFPGYTTYAVQPAGFEPPSDRTAPAAGKNITAGLETRPAAIVVNLPSNDQAKGYSQAEQVENFDRIVATAAEAKVPIWITTTQPRNFNADQDRSALAEMRDVITQRYAPRTIDFWTPIADGENRVLAAYDSGDGVHINDAGHALLFEQVRDAALLE